MTHAGKETRLYGGRQKGEKTHGKGRQLCVELRGYVLPRVGDALAVTHIPPYTSGVLTPIPLRVYLGHG